MIITFTNGKTVETDGNRQLLYAVINFCDGVVIGNTMRIKTSKGWITYSTIDGKKRSNSGELSTDMMYGVFDQALYNKKKTMINLYIDDGNGDMKKCGSMVSVDWKTTKRGDNKYLNQPHMIITSKKLDDYLHKMHIV